jgi:4-amino-4-deoxy-L-arabinose transferase-like glycosyltransferase
MLKLLELCKPLKGKGESFPVQSAVIIFILLAGLGITAWGFYSLASSSEATPWRWKHSYLVSFMVLVSIIAMGGVRRGPRTAGIVVFGALTIGLGVAIPTAVVVILALSAYTLGCLILRDQETSPADNLLVGVVLFGTVLGLLVYVPINNTGTWGLLFALPLLFGWRHLHALWSSNVSSVFAVESVDLHQYLLHCAIFAAALLHFLVGLMPEVGHDALAMHLFIASHISHHQFWNFDTGIYVWAVMPMLVDWLYTAGYLFAGETGARLVNVGSIMLLAALVHRVASWAGASRVNANWAVLMLLVTPLTFLESASLFVEGMWSVLVVGGALALLRLLTQPSTARTEIVLAGLLLGGALAAKAVTLTVLPVLALVLLIAVRRWLSRDLLPVAGISLLIFIAVGVIPYLTAYVKTGNPVFPFFNAYFQSPLYPAENFSAAAFFERGFTWDTVYRMTFNSGRFLEATPGASGFQWLLLVMPGVLAMALARHQRGLLVALFGTIWLWLAFSQTAYLRYVFPSFAMACVLIAIFLTIAKSAGRWAWGSALTVTFIALILNLLHFDSATYYGKIDAHVIADIRTRDAYLDKSLPLRSAVKLVNELNRGLAPVAFFSAPLTAGLKADALYANWYNPRYQNAVLSTGSSDDLGQMLASEGVEYIVVDDSWKTQTTYPFLQLLGSELAKIGSVSVLRLDDRFRFKEELLPSTTFKTGWDLAPGAIRLTDGSLQVSVESPAYSLVEVQSGKKYRYTADVLCANGPAKGRLQVNWLGPDGELLDTDIAVFDCSSEGKVHSMVIKAPLRARKAFVYASSHEKAPLVFKEISFRF